MQEIRVEGRGSDERRGDEDAGYQAEDGEDGGENYGEEVCGGVRAVWEGREREREREKEEGVLRIMFCGCMTLTAEIPMLLLAMPYAAPMLESTIAQQQPMAPKKDCGVEGWLLDSRWEYEGGGD